MADKEVFKNVSKGDQRRSQTIRKKLRISRKSC